MFPSLILENQFGEVSNNLIKGGSSQLNCNFIVDSTNGNGLGIRSLKGTGIANVFMHTSSTPAGGNPNPAAGYILVQFEEGFAGNIGGPYGFVATVSGTPINVTSGLTPGLAYIITSVGTTTAAQWQALGLPSNYVPAVGLAFICNSATVGVGTGVVEVQKATGSGIDHLEGVGDPNLMSQTEDGSGGSMILVALGATNSSTTTFVATAPANGTVIALSFNMVKAASPLI